MSSSTPRSVFVLGSVVLCLAAVGMRQGAAAAIGEPLTAWVTTWAAPMASLPGMSALGTWSEASLDALSLLVLGASLLGGGRIIRRLRQRSAAGAASDSSSRPTRAPLADVEAIRPRRAAR